jgi:hypothetical protein
MPAQAGQQRMRIGFEVGQGHGVAEREGATTIGGLRGPSLRLAGHSADGSAHRPPRPVVALITRPHPA